MILIRIIRRRREKKKWERECHFVSPNSNTRQRQYDDLWAVEWEKRVLSNAAHGRKFQGASDTSFSSWRIINIHIAFASSKLPMMQTGQILPLVYLITFGETEKAFVVTPTKKCLAAALIPVNSQHGD